MMCTAYAHSNPAYDPGYGQPGYSSGNYPSGQQPGGYPPENYPQSGICIISKNN